MTLLEQLPRFSAYDPGAVGEGGLDPLGLSAVADRIADVLAPGVRARMSQPRFVTLSAVGAIAYQTLHGLTADDGKTTVDIAYEWLVVEAMVRHPGNGRTEGLPGNQKAARAKQMNERLSRRTYLNGPASLASLASIALSRVTPACSPMTTGRPKRPSRSCVHGNVIPAFMATSPTLSARPAESYERRSRTHVSALC